MIKRFLLLLALAGCCLQGRAAVPPPQNLLPKDTVLAITAPDWSSAWTFATNSQYGRLWSDPAVHPIKDKFIDKLTSDALKPAEKTLGLKFTDFQGLLQGQVTFALLPASKKENSDNHFSQVLLIDTKSHVSQLKTNLASITKKWTDAGKPVKAQKIREVDFTTLIVSPSDLSWSKIFPQSSPSLADDTAPPKPAEKNSEITFGQIDSLLIVSDSTDAIEKILNLLNGGLLPPLASQPAFQSDYQARLHDAPFYCWVDLKSLVSLMTAAPPGADEDTVASAAKLNSYVTALGLDAVTSACISYKNVPDGSAAEFFLGAPESKRSGILKLLAPGLKDSNPPGFVPADAAKFWRWRIDIPHSWAMLESMLNDLNPQVKRLVDFIMENAGKDKDPNYNLKSELLANLGDDVISYEKTPSGNTLSDLKNPPTVYLIGSPNPDKLSAAISVALGIVGQNSGGVKDREFLGRNIHSVTLGAPGGATSQTLNFAGSGGYLALSTDAAIIEEFLRSSDNKAKSLSDTESLADAAQQVGGFSSGWFGYENQSLTMRPTFDLFRKRAPTLSDIAGPTPVDSNASIAGQIAGKLLSWTDFSLLPPFDQVSKYFSYSVYSGRFTPEGFTMKIFAPTPPGLR